MILAAHPLSGVLVMGAAMLGAASVLFGSMWLMSRMIRWNSALRHAARELNLHHRPSGLTHKGRVAGMTRGVRVSVDARWQFTNPLRWVEIVLPGGARPIKAWTRVVVSTDTGEQVALRRRPQLDGQIRREFTDADVLTGDRVFDDKVRCRGPVAEVRARLSQSAREAALVAIADLGGRLDEREVHIEQEGYVDDGRRLAFLARAAIRLGSALRSDGRDTARLLFERFESDPVDEVRLAAFDTLLEEFPDDAATADAVRMVLEAADPQWSADGDERLRTLSQVQAPLVPAAAQWALERPEIR